MSDQPTVLTGKLSPTERSDLERCEKIIRRGKKVFVQVSEALMEIRDKQLYREYFSTFEKYCQKRWGFSARHGQRLLAAHEVIENLRPIGRIPDNERQTRPLVSLPPETQREVWQEAVETAPDGKVTAAHIQATIDQHQQPREGAPADDVSASIMRPMGRILEPEMPSAPKPAEPPKDWMDTLITGKHYPVDRKRGIVVNEPFDTYEECRAAYPGLRPESKAHLWVNKTFFGMYRLIAPEPPATPALPAETSAPEGQAFHAAGIDDSTSPDEPTTPRHDPRAVSNTGEWTPGETAYMHRAQAAVNHAHPGKMPHVGNPVDEVARLKARIAELEAENETLRSENLRLKAEVVVLRNKVQPSDGIGKPAERITQ